MSKRVALVAAALVAVAIAGFAGAGPAAATVTCDCGAQATDQVTPYSPDAATAAASAPESSGVSVASVEDPSTALAAASAPGADTEVEPDLTPQQAVGIAPSSDSTTTATSRIVCWTEQAWGQWGIWPYHQKIVDTTHWCARYGTKITFRTTSVSASGLLCGVSWRSALLIGGGVGYPTFTERSSAGFSCPTDIPWITLHPTHHLDVKRDAFGNATIVGSG